LGGISLEALWTVLPELQIDIQFAPKGTESPGQLDHHYAPRCALIPLDSLTEKPDEQAHLLLFSQKPGGPAGSHIHYLTPKGDLNEAAAVLFSLLRSFDDRQLDRVYFEWAPNEGLGRAINDRLSRAQKK
jgi:L-threonylcarbamoyladenylate synthase